METLREFRERTGGFTRDSLRGWAGDFCTSDGLAQKVDERGRLRPYFGNTVIFELTDADRMWLQSVQARLHAAGAQDDCFSERLLPQTFHITLHDLISGPSLEGVIGRVRSTGAHAREMLNAVRAQFSGEIRLRSTCLFNMVNTSVVLGFEPASEADCRAIMELYGEFQQVVPLNYGLTPHVTMAYYRPGVYGEDITKRLRAAFHKFDRVEPRRELCLSMDRLCYRCFADMNCYLEDEAAMAGAAEKR